MCLAIIITKDDKVIVDKHGHLKLCLKYSISPKDVIGGGWLCGNKITTYSGSFGKIPEDKIGLAEDEVYLKYGIIIRTIRSGSPDGRASD